MKTIFTVAAVLVVIALGIGYVADQGATDRDVPGKTTDAGTSKLGD